MSTIPDLRARAVASRRAAAATFLYRRRGDGRARWADGMIEVAKVVNPYPAARAGWTHADVSLVFDLAAARIVREHGEGRLRHGVTRSYALAVLRETAHDYAGARHLQTKADRPV